MQKFIKNTKGLGIHQVLIILISLMGFNKVVAQTQQQYVDYLKVVKPVMDHSTLSYKYTLALVEQTSGKKTDRIDGILLRKGNQYLDSNSNTVTLSNEGYLFKAQNIEKAAVVYSAKVLQKNTAGKAMIGPNQVFSIPDSLLLKRGKFSEIALSGELLHFKYVPNDRSMGVKEMQFKIAKDKMVLLEIILVLQDDNNLERVFTLYDFNNSFDEKRMSTSNFFSITCNKVALQNRFRSFKINALL